VEEKLELDEILKKLEKISGIPTLPSVALQVNQLLSDPKAPVQKLGDIITKDQAMTSNILRLVNSAFYGFQSKIESIQRAIMVLGVETVRNSVLAVSVIQSFPKGSNLDWFDMPGLWRHSIAVAVTCRHLSRRMPLEQPDNCFLGGLVHDLGKVIIVQHLGSEYAGALDLIKTGVTFHDAELRADLPGHDAIGGGLAQKWRFPPRIIDAIKYHHDPNKDQQPDGLSLMVHGADIIVNSLASKSPASPKIMASPHNHHDAWLAAIADAPIWFKEILPEIEAAWTFYNI
jgi:putative nucleotidyltransferase with HDIG domain